MAPFESDPVKGVALCMAQMAQEIALPFSAPLGGDKVSSRCGPFITCSAGEAVAWGWCQRLQLASWLRVPESRARRLVPRSVEALSLGLGDPMAQRCHLTPPRGLAWLRDKGQHGEGSPVSAPHETGPVMEEG